MTELKATTQRAQNMVSSYKHSLLNHGVRDIYGAYGHCSEEKRGAWLYCCKLRDDNHGENLTVVGKTCYVFTAAFTFVENGKKYLCYITKDNDYKITLN